MQTKIEEWAALIASLTIFASLFFWAATVAGQIYYYARYGGYSPLPAKILFVGTTETPMSHRPFLEMLIPERSLGWRWLDSPQDWYGLHSVFVWILDSFSIGGFLFVSALLVSLSILASLHSVANSTTAK